MELIIMRAAFTVYWIFAAFGFAKAAYKEYQQNNNITFAVITDAAWSIGQIAMPYIISTDVHGLFDIKMAWKICIGLYAFLISLFFIQFVIETIRKFKSKEYLAGMGMAIVCILFAMFTALPPIILHEFF